ncbi:MAG TPA: hypothetical protein VFS43_15350 [Polyangiaceae bacterium]|nr:hypothetical protein [Polyangiaceae bacterium]
MTKPPTVPAPEGESGSEAADALPWDKRVLALLPPGVDRSQIRENVRLSPTERVERMLAFAAFAEEYRGRARVRTPPAR